MSSIYTYGYGYNKKLCEDITARFLNTYHPRHNLVINIIHRGMKRDGVYGWCDISTERMSRPRKFMIELQSNMPRDLYISTLFHELIHVKQWVRGELSFRAGKMLYDGENVSQWDYDKQPHEVEAHSKEKVLTKIYKRMTVEDLAHYPPVLLD